jgi:integrase
MASLHRHAASPFWYVAYRLPDGRRALRSTRQTSKAKAAEVARLLERTAAATRRGELTEAKARMWVDEMLESTGLAAVRRDSVRDFANMWLAGKGLSVTPGIMRRYKRALKLFLEGLDQRALKPLSAVTPADIAAYRDARMAEAIAPGTLHHYLKIVRSIFATARRQGLVLTNPAEAIDLPRLRTNERSVFTPAEVAALLALAAPEWRTLTLLAYYTGARLGDLSRLEWSAIDLAAGLITFRQGKTQQKVVLPIHPTLAEHLLSIAGDQGGSVCPVLARTHISQLSTGFVELMRRAGIDSESVKTSKNAFATKSFHSLRHSFSSSLAAAGIPADLRMKLTGHRSLDEHLGYTHVELSALRGAIEALPRLSTTHG